MSFLEELQALDDKNKVRIQVIAAVIIMAIIIYFWMGYFNNIVMNNAQEEAMSDQGTKTAAMTPRADEPGFFQKMGNDMASAANILGNFFKSPSKYNVQPH